MGLDYYLYPFNLSTYEARVYPAYKSLTQSGDAEPLLALVYECDRILAAEPILREKLYWSKETVAEDVGVLESTRDDKEYYTRVFLAPKLLEVLCVPRSAEATPQDMCRSPLAR